MDERGGGGGAAAVVPSRSPSFQHETLIQRNIRLRSARTVLQTAWRRTKLYCLLCLCKVYTGPRGVMANASDFGSED